MQEQFEKIRQQIIAKLRSDLDPKLIYHNLEHTLDVIKQSEVIALAEGIEPGYEMELLKTAASFHDSGFLYTYKNHEERSCEIARKELEGFLSEDDLEKVFGMIMATKIPQMPHNLLQQIICDADLDYLGRDDFEPISKNLYKEFIDFGIIPEEIDWDAIQIKFFETHHYFTQTTFAKRNNQKQEHLLQLKSGNGS